jgi:hypothetical protein
MATGYTYAIHDGEDISFENFVLQCSRGMGARIEERENPTSDYAPRLYEPSTFYRDELKKAEEKLLRYQAMTPAEASAEALGEYVASCDRQTDWRAKEDAMRARYDAMLDQVYAWEPPTADHEGFKTFMIEQLESSIEFDCPAGRPLYRTDPELLSGTTWLAAKIATAEESVKRDADEWEKEQERTQGRNDWMTALCESLSIPAPTK